MTLGWIDWTCEAKGEGARRDRPAIFTESTDVADDARFPLYSQDSFMNLVLIDFPWASGTLASK
jgi:hypothetical protein